MGTDGLFDFTVDKKDRCWVVTGYHGKSKEVIFPASFKNIPIKKITRFLSSSQKNRIKRVVIPEGYTYIGEHAFSYCEKLTNIRFPKSLNSIGAAAFAGCIGLTSIEIPKNLTSIENRTFQSCIGLKSIEFPESLTSIGDYAFQDCNGLTNIKFPESLTSIGYQVFSDCTKLTSIEFPESLTSIGDCAFSDCTRLTNIEFPESLTSIGNYAFSHCTRLTNIEFPESLTSIGNCAFSDCTRLTNIKLPKNLTSIESDTFFGCENLTEINVDENNPVFCSVDDVLFDKTMTTLILFPEGKKGVYAVPEGIISIRNDAINNCELTGISFPQSLLSFKDVKVFEFIDLGSEITDITVNELNPQFCSIDGVLFDKKKSELISYPKNKKWKNYVIPDGIHYINNKAFCDCIHLVNIVLPESLEFINARTFADCKKLKTVTLSRKTIIGHEKFKGFKGRFIYRD